MGGQVVPGEESGVGGFKEILDLKKQECYCLRMLHTSYMQFFQIIMRNEDEEARQKGGSLLRLMKNSSSD